MGRKINPTGFRLAVRRDWKSRWFAKGREFAQMVVEDAEIRAMIETDHGSASISRIEIARTSKSAQVTIHSARPGMIIGKKGEGIDRLRARLRAKMGITDLSVDVAEVRQPELNAKLGRAQYRLAVGAADYVSARDAPRDGQRAAARRPGH